MKPDFGSALLQDGVPPNAVYIFPDFCMYDFGILGLGKFTTTVDHDHDEVVHAASFDFGVPELEKIMEHVPPDVGYWLIMQADDPAPRSVRLPEPISFGVVARLGKPQYAPQEVFVPLIIKDVF